MLKAVMFCFISLSLLAGDLDRTPTLAEQLKAVKAPWTQKAPGVWEKVDGDTTYRFSSGAFAFQLDLDNLHAEMAEVERLALESDNAELDKRMEKLLNREQRLLIGDVNALINQFS